MIVKFRNEDGYGELTKAEVKSFSKSGGEHKNYIVKFNDGTKEVVENKVVWFVEGDK